MKTLTLNEKETSILFNSLSERISMLNHEVKTLRANQQELKKPQVMQFLIDDFLKQINTCEKLIDKLYDDENED